MSHRSTSRAPILTATRATKTTIGESGRAACRKQSRNPSLRWPIAEESSALVSYEYSHIWQQFLLYTVAAQQRKRTCGLRKLLILSEDWRSREEARAASLRRSARRRATP